MMASTEVLEQPWQPLRNIFRVKVRGRGFLWCWHPVIQIPSLRRLPWSMKQGWLHWMQTELLPLVDWITPNQAELAVLSGERRFAQPAGV